MLKVRYVRAGPKGLGCGGPRSGPSGAKSGPRFARTISKAWRMLSHSRMAAAVLSSKSTSSDPSLW